MGNSLCSVGLLRNVEVGDTPYHVQLGRRVSINLSRTKVNEIQNGRRSEKWTMSYIVDGSTCALELTRRFGKRGDAKGVLLELSSMSPVRDGNSMFLFRIDIQKTETDVLVSNWSIPMANNISLSIEQSKQIHAGDSVTETDVYLYGIGHKGGLIVVERKRKNGEEQAYALTVAHYHATSTGINDYSKTKIDFGLSVVAKIRASNGNLDIKVEGPDQHPASALFYLFDEVIRTGIWKPTICPHCANIRKQRSRIWQSDSEDSDVPPRRQNGRSLANDGAFVGDGNGNFFERNVMVFKGRS